jgi:putative sterol carrier protein
MPTTQELFTALDERLKENPDKTAGLSATYQFNIEGDGGGVWHLVVDDGTAEVAEGPAPSPDMTSIMTVEDYVAMATGQTSGRDLFFSGRMRVEGNPMLGMRLGELLN